MSELGREKRLGKRSLFHIGALEVVEHPREKLPAGARLEQRAVEPRVVAGVFQQERPAASLVELATAVERIENDRAARVVAGICRHPQQKVAGERDAEHLEARAPRDFDVDEAQRDRDARASFDDDVEEAVAEVAVVGAVAGKPFVVVEQTVELGDSRSDRRVMDRVEPPGSALAQIVETRDGRPRIELRILDSRDHERGTGKVERLCGRAPHGRSLARADGSTFQSAFPGSGSRSPARIATGRWFSAGGYGQT